VKSCYDVRLLVITKSRNLPEFEAESASSMMIEALIGTLDIETWKLAQQFLICDS
jgi:hypothetical protein